jgi:hypothetical protein
MIDKPEVDCSPEAVARVCRNLTDDRNGTGYERWFIAELLGALSSALAQAEKERDALHERLEDNHVFVWDKATDKMVRTEVDPGSVPDGIECRNETIKLQDEALAKLRAQLAEARGENAKLRKQIDDDRERAGDDDTFW